MIAKHTLLTTQLTPSGSLNNRLRKCVTLVDRTHQRYLAATQCRIRKNYLG